jgi:predicted HTH domain antitoxin
VQHSIVQNLETELKRQQDHYIKLIEQNNVIFDSKEKSYETEITQLRQELSKYQINLRTLEDNHSRIT